MILSADVLSILTIVALGLVVVLLIGMTVLSLRLRSLRKAYASALDPSRREDLFQAVQRQAGDLDALRGDLVAVNANTEHLRELLRGAVSKVGIVRYDAFADMGGALSFSAALLDEHGHGVVISAINGRSETRCYAKPVVAGDSEHNLSQEEVAAVDEALSGRRGTLVGAGGRKRGRKAVS